MTDSVTNEQMLRQVVDHQAIERVLRRYCRGVDRADTETLKSVFHSDAVNEDRGSGTNAHEWVDVVIPTLKAMFTGTMHHITNFDIQLDGDRAVVECYYIAYHELQRSEDLLKAFAGDSYVERMRAAGRLDGGHEYIGKGRYFFRFERRAGEWRMTLRIATFEFNELRPMVIGDPGSGLDQMPRRERHSREDPVFDLLEGRKIAGIES
jgi:hypothetical protein